MLRWPAPVLDAAVVVRHRMTRGRFSRGLVAGTRFTWYT
jgi:hypothetical protein